MKPVRRARKIIWFLSGSIALAAVIVFAWSRRTGANPPGACRGCARACLEIPCEDHSNPELSCRDGRTPDKDDGCRTKEGKLCEGNSIRAPYPGYDVSCDGNCVALDTCGQFVYSASYLSHWKKKLVAGTTGSGKIGYDFTCKIDPKFNDFGTAGCKDQEPCKLKENPPNGARFRAETYVEVTISAPECVSQSPDKETQKWLLTRVVTPENPCPGKWEEKEDVPDPPAYSMHVWLPATCECSEEAQHKVKITIDVWVKFEQDCLVMTGKPQCEVLITDTVFKCL